MTPQLRFPEFTDEWQDKKLGDLSNKPQYGMNAAAKAYDGENKYLRITDIDEDTRQFSAKSLTSPSGALSNNYLLKKDDLLLARTGASTGKSYLYNEKDGRVYFAGFLIRFHIDDADPYFVFLQTVRPQYQKWVSVMSARSGQPGINAEEFATLKIAAPSKSEQQKIADFLTSVDDKIAALDKKVKLLKQYKKGVMQQIFSQTIRFKDKSGNPYPDWEEKRLGDFGDFYRGLTYSAKNVKSNGTLVLRSSNIQDGQLVLDKDLQFVDKPSDANTSLTKGDIVICMANGSKSLVGKTGVYKGGYDGPLTVGAFCSIYRGPSSLTKYLFQTYSYTKYLDILLAGTNINNLKNSDLANLKFKVPSSHDEKQKIASFLAVIDSKIATEQTRLSATKEWKKGLLQRMFV